ncbi:MAG TPA: XRE family transcriptional regulator [Burkholderiales bacterium]|nr:XRE family transcriptional regulator [Burkholderiales bacterium]
MPRKTSPAIDEPHAFWRLKRLRELKGLTLEALAERTGLTKSYLSKVERGRSVPSISTAIKLAEGFDVAVGDLFGIGGNSNDFAIVRKHQRKPFNRHAGQSAGYRYEAIAPGVTHGLFEAFVMQPPFEGAPAPDTFEHGGEEMIFVLSGKLQLSLPNHVVTLEPGDCAVFDAHLPHRSTSLGKTQAEALVIVTSSKAAALTLPKTSGRAKKKDSTRKKL